MSLSLSLSNLSLVSRPLTIYSEDSKTLLIWINMHSSFDNIISLSYGQSEKTKHASELEPDDEP